jgi:hypothetical protein
MPVWRAESARPGDRLQISCFVCDQVGLLPAEFLIWLGLPHHAKLLDLTRRMLASRSRLYQSAKSRMTFVLSLFDECTRR